MNPGTFAGAVPGMPLQQGYMRQVLYPLSGYFYVPKTGYYEVFAIGAGGNGGLAMVNTQIGCAGGGGGGGCSIKTAYLTKGAVLTITVGAGATYQAQSSIGTQTGNSGGNTTVTGGGISLFAGGGAGGTAGTTSGVTYAGGVGGSASGGDLNFKGGDGGSAIATTTGICAGGGGAVSFYGANTRGGNASHTGSGRWPVAGGGGGIGGNGGDATATSNYAAGAGGSYSSNGTNATSGVAATTGAIAYLYQFMGSGNYYNASNFLTPAGPPSAGQNDGASSTAYMGSGSGACVGISVTPATGGTSWAFGGSGGVADTSGTSPIALPNVRFGGGNGGSANYLYSVTQNNTIGGLVVISWVQQ